eukprot:GHVT01019427.1.p1 GENE.GHVT01019427.1~~GHVT01019427.1.p1  ORF type:complete len:682 (+),score=179.37 GHVT01019427.1:264-2309(+)
MAHRMSVRRAASGGVGFPAPAVRSALPVRSALREVSTLKQCSLRGCVANSGFGVCGRGRRLWGLPLLVLLALLSHACRAPCIAVSSAALASGRPTVAQTLASSAAPKASAPSSSSVASPGDSSLSRWRDSSVARWTRRAAAAVAPFLTPQKMAQQWARARFEIATALGLWNIQRPTEDQAMALPGMPSLQTLRSAATLLLPTLRRLKERRFFRFFRVDLERPCPFWASASMCQSAEGHCHVCECDDDEIPQGWKQKPTEHFVDRRTSAAPSPGSTSSFSPRAPFDGVGSARGPVYVDLLLNGPSFTGFQGAAVWRRIYWENCFGPESATGLSEDAQPTNDAPNNCQEQQAFYRILSGMHSNIAALAAEYYTPVAVVADKSASAEYGHANSAANPPAVTWPPPASLAAMPPREPPTVYQHSLSFFREKLAAYPDRIANLFVTFHMLLRTVAQVAPVLEECTCDTGSPQEDLAARADLLLVLSETVNVAAPTGMADPPLFRRRTDDMMRHVHNITRILDCVECEKCRLHGNIKLSALQVAVKAAAADQHVTTLERNEVTALISALTYFADSILILDRFEARLTRRRLEVVTCICLGLLSLLLLAYWLRSHRARLPSAPPSTPTEDSFVASPAASPAASPCPAEKEALQAAPRTPLGAPDDSTAAEESEDTTGSRRGPAPPPLQ